jgi:ABC-2 type transport system permease protein
VGVRRVAVLIWKELIELKEDPRLFGIVIIAPILQLLLLGYAATTDIQNVPVVISDGDRSPMSRELVDRIRASPNFQIVDIVSGVNEIDRYLERGTAWMAIAIPAGYGSGVSGGRSQSVAVIADGSDASSTNVALGYATSLMGGYAQELAARRLASTMAIASGGAAAAGGIDARVRVWFNPGLESRDFMIPGVVAMLLLMITTNLSSMGIVREKELGTLEQLNVTPLRRWELILGKLLPYALVGMIDVVLVLAVAVLWFQVPLRGSVPLLLGMSLVFLLSTLGLGLLISTMSSTQQQAMMTTIFFFLTPMMYLSGFVFPIENMPKVIQLATYGIPLRYFLIILRSIFLKGVGLETFWPEALALAACGLVLFALAIARSSKRTA